MKITADGFIWKIISTKEAEAFYKISDVYTLYDDDSDSLVEYSSEIVDGRVYGLEVGFLPTEEVPVSHLEHLGRGVYIKKD
jgi:hypothetical protein